MKVNYRSSGPQIGAVLKKFAPFLKLYTDYIKNFDNATSTITSWTTKSAKFMSLLEEIQVCFCCYLVYNEFCCLILVAILVQVFVVNPLYLSFCLAVHVNIKTYLYTDYVFAFVCLFVRIISV